MSLGFDKSTNIFYGDNAQGKTNILEAVYLSGTTKSHRGTKDKDMIQFGANESHIETIVEKNGIKYQIDMHLKTVPRELRSTRFLFGKPVSYLVL